MRTLPKPSPAMVVALLALVLAVAGTATAALTGKDKKKVRNVADQEIAKKAGGLSVANAANATNAANAGNASTLGGIAAGSFPQVFLGTADSTSIRAPIFSVPQVGVTILSDSSASTSSDFEVRNDNSSASVVIGTTADSTMGTLVTHGNTSLDISGTASPVLITVNGKPNTALMVTCAIGANAGADLVCLGLLKG
jgi:hypothetical protein